MPTYKVGVYLGPHNHYTWLGFWDSTAATFVQDLKQAVPTKDQNIQPTKTRTDIYTGSTSEVKTPDA